VGLQADIFLEMLFECPKGVLLFSGTLFKEPLQEGEIADA